MIFRQFGKSHKLGRAKLLCFRILCCAAIGALSLAIIVLHEVSPVFSGLLDIALASYMLSHFLGFKCDCIILDSDSELRSKIRNAVNRRS